jgi:hypothetical protein
MTLLLALGHLSISQVSLPFSLLFVTSSPPNVLRALLPFCTHLRPRNFLIIPSFSRSLLQATFSSHSFHFASFPLHNYLRSFPFSLISLPLIVPHSRRTKILLSCGHPEIALSYHTLPSPYHTYSTLFLLHNEHSTPSKLRLFRSLEDSRLPNFLFTITPPTASLRAVYVLIHALGQSTTTTSFNFRDTYVPSQLINMIHLY